MLACYLLFIILALGCTLDLISLYFFTLDSLVITLLLQAYLKEKQDSTMGVSLVEATVTQVESVGMGDRVCVDLCNLLNPGEGLLVSCSQITKSVSSFHKF